MNEIYNFKGQEVRTVTIDNEPYFLGNDVANILGYKRPGDAIKQHIDEDDRKTLTYKAFGDLEHSLWKGNDFSNKTFITESGVYALIFGSELPQAKEFKRWVTSEVLPTIRKHGMYATEQLLDNPDFAIEVFNRLKEEREVRKSLEAKIETDKPKVIFADAVSTSKTSILVGDYAKFLRQNGLNYGQNRLFAWMRENGYLISRKGASWNMPTQRSMELGLFEIKETAVQHSDGHVTVNKTPKVTGKGQLYFSEKLLG